MERKIYSLMNTPKLQNLLNWIVKVTNISGVNKIKPFEKRAIALQNICALAISRAFTLGKVNILVYIELELNESARKLSRIDSLYDYLSPIIEINSYAHGYGDRLNYEKHFKSKEAYIRGHSRDLTTNKYIDKFSDYDKWLKQHEIFSEISFSEIISLSKAQEKNTNNENQSDAVFAKKIINYWQNAFNISPEILDLSQSEIEILDDYIYTNLLMWNVKKQQ